MKRWKAVLIYDVRFVFFEIEIPQSNCSIFILEIQQKYLRVQLSLEIPQNKSLVKFFYEDSLNSIIFFNHVITKRSIKILQIIIIRTFGWQMRLRWRIIDRLTQVQVFVDLSNLLKDCCNQSQLKTRLILTEQGLTAQHYWMH